MTEDSSGFDAQEQSEDIEPTNAALDQDARLIASSTWRDEDSGIVAIAPAGGRYVYAVLPIWKRRYWAGVRIEKQDMAWPLRSDHFETTVITLNEKDAVSLTWQAMRDDP